MSSLSQESDIKGQFTYINVPALHVGKGARSGVEEDVWIHPGDVNITYNTHTHTYTLNNRCYLREKS